MIWLRQEKGPGSDKAQRLREAMESELKQHPGDAYASAKLGGLLVSEGRHADAITLLKTALTTAAADAPQRYELLLHLGLALTPSDPSAAVQAYRDALAIPQDPRASLGASLNLAARLMEQSQLDEAIALTRTATEQAPEVAMAWYNLGLMQRQAGDIAGALQSYDQALRLSPENAACHQNLAVAQLLGGNIDAARNSFRTAITLLQSQGQHEQASQRHLQLLGPPLRRQPRRRLGTLALQVYVAGVKAGALGVGLQRVRVDLRQ